jgi:hypothetical protein
MLPSHVLKAVEMGLIPAGPVIRWADQQIVATDQPEPWLIELATAGSDNHDIISMMKHQGVSTEVDGDTFLALVAYGFFHSRMTLAEARTALYQKFCLNDPKEMTALRQQVYILDDEMGWDSSRAQRTCEAILDPFLEIGEQLLGPYTDGI